MASAPSLADLLVMEEQFHLQFVQRKKPCLLQGEALGQSKFRESQTGVHLLAFGRCINRITGGLV